jgi:hypothetical protein
MKLTFANKMEDDSLMENEQIKIKTDSKRAENVLEVQDSIDIKIEDLSEDLTPQNQISLKFQEEIKIEIEPESELKSCGK